MDDVAKIGVGVIILSMVMHGVFILGSLSIYTNQYEGKWVYQDGHDVWTEPEDYTPEDIKDDMRDQYYLMIVSGCTMLLLGGLGGALLRGNA